eukprot:1162002-Rhodomonas_salina.1
MRSFGARHVQTHHAVVAVGERERGLASFLNVSQVEEDRDEPVLPRQRLFGMSPDSQIPDVISGHGSARSDSIHLLSPENGVAGFGEIGLRTCRSWGRSSRGVPSSAVLSRSAAPVSRATPAAKHPRRACISAISQSRVQQQRQLSELSELGTCLLSRAEAGTLHTGDHIGLDVGAL